MGEKVRTLDPDTEPTLSKIRDGIQLDQHVSEEAEKPHHTRNQTREGKARTQTPTQVPHPPNKNVNKTSYLKVMAETRHFSLCCWLTVRWEHVWPQHMLL